MRFAVKGTLLLLALYVAVCAAFIAWSWRLQRRASTAVMRATAVAVAEQVAALLDEELGAELLAGGPDARRRTLNRFHEVIRSSAVIEALDVVSARGEVFASGDFSEIGERARPADELFGPDLRPQLEPVPHDPTRYQVAVPLARGGAPVGYLRVRLRFGELVALERNARGQLLLATLLGVAAITLSGLTLQIKLQRRLAELQRALDAALAGGAPDAAAAAVTRAHDEFGQALASAGRLGRELQQQRERTTQASRRLLRFAHLVDVGVILLGPAGELEFASPRAAELFGLASDAPPELWREQLAPLQASLADPGNGLPAAIDVSPPGSGRRRALRCQAHRLDERGDGSWLVLVRDRELVTALESDLRMAAQLRGLTRLYMGVAHDLKAPLNAMVLNLELLRRSITAPWMDDEDELRGRQLEWTAIVESELGRLRRSLEALLAQTAPPRDERERFDLRDVLGEIVALLQPQARQQRVQVQVEVPETTVAVSGSRDQLKQAILNLAINGLEAAPETGSLALRLHPQDDEAVVRVQDTGTGIPPEVLEQVFDMHFTTKASGSGIGLHVARTILESHAGTVEVESTGPEGTTFEVRLPLAPERT
jgi:signal transduction histidine kinase